MNQQILSVTNLRAGDLVQGVFKGVRIAGMKGLQDVSIENGRVVAILPSAAITSDSGYYLLPPFIDCHFHLDSVYSLEDTGENQSGTLWEGIELWRRYKATIQSSQILERSLRYCREACQQGILAIRSHVDVSYESMAGVEALLELREKLHSVQKIQLVAFPQDGYLRNPSGVRYLEQALDAGIDLVGGIPHFERTYADGEKSIDLLCRLAAERGLRVDMHCDETDDARSRHVETLAAKTIEYGLQGMVSASHATSLHSVDTAWFQKLVPLLLDAGITIIPNPLINITLQGRVDDYPKRRGVTRIPELMQAGVPVALGQDCVCDPWYPLGTGNMLDVAHMTAHVCQLTGAEQLESLRNLITTHPAQAMGWKDYGLDQGRPADFLLFKAKKFSELLRARVPPLLVVKGGKILCKTESPVSAQIS